MTNALENYTSYKDMEHRSGPMLAVAAWLGWLIQLIATHFSAALSVACGAAALVASVYSIKASRAKEHFYENLNNKPGADEES